MPFVLFIAGVIVGMVGSYIRGAIIRWEDEQYENRDDE